jgi:hypothetical protein
MQAAVRCGEQFGISRDRLLDTKPCVSNEQVVTEEPSEGQVRNEKYGSDRGDISDFV